jgi:enoyl-CoA hydratase/carnithine racemase
MPSSNVLFDIDGSIAFLTFNRPQARNALTWDMYDGLAGACERVDGDPALRVLVIRGSGGSFAAGTDIAQFRDFRSGADGVAYERRLDAVVDRLERVTRPTIAQVAGPAVGGGLAIALACDFRLCTAGAQFGVPIARTLGNCLSMANCARASDFLGPALFRDLMLTGRLIDGAEALRRGLVTAVADAGTLDDVVRELSTKLAARAPLTIEVTKAMLQRIRDHRRPPPADDLVARCYGSADFREGVTAFLDGRAPRFEGH